MKRILFVSENVTLAQVVRLVTLASALDREKYEVHFACSAFDDLVFGQTDFVRHPIASISRARVDRALATGRRLYGLRDLRAYAAEELALFARVRPALVVGDFRLSLAASCPVAGVPYASLINAYWSPFATREAVPLPEHPIVRLLGVELAGRYFSRAVPTVFAHFAKPVNDLRLHYGLPALGSLREVLTQGDYAFHPDIPDLVETRGAPSTHVFLGHVPWSPSVPLPDLRTFDAALPIVYVALGSSGPVDRLPLVLRALARLPVNVLVSTAGRAAPIPPAPRLTSAPFIPGDLAAARASIVISNGGASTAYQALVAGRPVIGVAANLDQYFAMTAIAEQGGGVLLRAGTVDEVAVRSAMESLLASAAMRADAEQLASSFARYDPRAIFRAWTARIVGA